MTSVYQYSIVRFRPFAETGEFANIGIFAVGMADRKIAFELAPKRFPRIRGFFDAAAHEAYGAAIDFLSVELARVAEFLPHHANRDGHDIFNDIVRRKESSITFSEPRAVQDSAPLHTIVERLFARFVKRDFAVYEPAEVVLTRDIRAALRDNGIRYFKHLKIVDDVVPVQFPLAFKDETIYAIRPLAFSQKSPLAIFDHGSHWRRRLEYLLEKGQILKDNVLLAIEKPVEVLDYRVSEAFELAINELRALPFPVLPGEIDGVVNPEIVTFAERVRPFQHRLMH